MFRQQLFEKKIEIKYIFINTFFISSQHGEKTLYNAKNIHICIIWPVVFQEQRKKTFFIFSIVLHITSFEFLIFKYQRSAIRIFIN